MPLAIRKHTIVETVAMLRLVEENAADDITRSEAKRLADLWEQQLNPAAIIVVP